jgi:aspartokinase/homoserine dehydrogenase 1
MNTPPRDRTLGVRLRNRIARGTSSDHSSDASYGSAFEVRFADCCGLRVNSTGVSAEHASKHISRSAANCRTDISRMESAFNVAEIFSDHFPQHRPAYAHSRRNTRKPLRVMKFGGTSVGDASCIKKVVEIIRAARLEGDVLVVVSAMSGVTNKLLEAAAHSKAGNGNAVAMIFEELRFKHDAAVSALFSSISERLRIGQIMQELFEECDYHCQKTMRLRELTPRARDLISSLGERISAPLIAAALAEAGVSSEAIDATELVVTDSCYGAAEPLMDLTRERSEARLQRLLQRGIVPVVTGFIGATAEGVLTTLGRGGSDYSATILGAVLDAGEIIIWTDVDGLLTADPRLVPGTSTIPEISYQEAAELAHFGAKVLHPKTLRAVMQSGIPVWIRNTFAPERRGTKITPMGPHAGGGVRAVTAISDVALITLGGPGIVAAPHILDKVHAIAATIGDDLLLISQSPSQDNVSLVVSSALAKRTVEALRDEFRQHLAQAQVDHITVYPAVAMVTMVGQIMQSRSELVGRAFDALDQEKVKVIAIARGSSERNISYVVAQKDAEAALITTHREFRLDALNS